jgi:hypothetical protein
MDSINDCVHLKVFLYLMPFRAGEGGVLTLFLYLMPFRAGEGGVLTQFFICCKTNDE